MGDQIRAFVERSSHAAIMVTDNNTVLSLENSIQVVQPTGTCKGGEFEGVKLITPKYFLETHEGQHPMFTPQRTTETAEWLKECDIV